MANFRRSGHWRTNSCGTTFWVGEHDVSRDDWDRFSYSQPIVTIKPYCCSYSSFINPNTTCPVCGEQVFYYENSYGGRVYFDSLGPPWPKHPCIDYVTTGTKPQKVKFSDWVNDLWQPFQIEKIENFDNIHFEVTGTLLKELKELTIYIEKNENIDKLKKNLCHIRMNNDQTIILSTFEIKRMNKSLSILELLFKGSLSRPSVKGTIERK